MSDPSMPPMPPVPAMPLAYAYETNQRPGIITAIGVISIVVGSLGIIGSGLSGMYGMVFLIMSQVSNTLATMSPPPPTTSVASDIESGQGLAEEDRAIVLKQLTEICSLTPERAGHLNSLLAQRGERIFGFAGQPITPEAVSSRITRSGKQEEDDRPDFFLTGWGLVVIDDDSAMFETEGSEPYFASADDLEPEGEKTLAEAADLVVKEVEKTATINEAQKKGLKDFLSSPSQGLIEDFHDPTTDVSSASTLADGSLWVTFYNGSVQLDSKGRVTRSSVTNFNAFGGSGFNVSTESATLVMVEAVISLGLAIFLLVIGILTLRQSLRARKLHLIYAVLKIPCAILFAAAWTWMMGDLIESTGGGGQVVAAIVICTFAAVACIYPVALLYVMRRKSVKEYYDVKPA